MPQKRISVHFTLTENEKKFVKFIAQRYMNTDMSKFSRFVVLREAKKIYQEKKAKEAEK
jgi:hypothetical protein